MAAPLLACPGTNGPGIDPIDFGESSGSTMGSTTSEPNDESADTTSTSGGPASAGPPEATGTAAQGESSSGDGSHEGTTGGPPAGAVPMFVALGEGGRTTISCDDGWTWIADQNIVDDNDDHGPYSSRGLAYGAGTFVAALGWGNPGSMRVSEDAVTWTQTFPGLDERGNEVVTSGMIGVAYGAGAFVAIDGNRPWRSLDGGLSWTSFEDVPDIDNLRSVAYSDHDGGRFYVVGDAGQIFVSADQGQTWQVPVAVECGDCASLSIARRGGAADGDGVFVLVTEDGFVYRSDDGGETFTFHSVSPGSDVGQMGNVVWTGDEFHAAGEGHGFTSPDGIEWSEVVYDIDASVRRMAYSPATGTFVGFPRDGATFYRSEDGQAWVELPADAHEVGTDLTVVVFGWGAASMGCE